MITFIASLLLVAGSSQPSSGGGWFVDRFSRLDPTRWMVSDGWSNGPWELNDWRASQVVVGRQGVDFSFARSSTYAGGYKSGEIQSRATYRYGYFEVSLQAPKGDGVVTGFFTYTGAPRGRPWNEVDVEILGKNTRAVQVTYHTDAGSWATTLPLKFDSSEGQHIYAFDRQPTYVRWYVDGVLIHEETGPNLAQLNESQQLMFQLWATDSNPGWAGIFKWPGAPLVARIGCMAAAPERPAAPLCQAQQRDSARASGAHRIR